MLQATITAIMELTEVGGKEDHCCDCLRGTAARLAAWLPLLILAVIRTLPSLSVGKLAQNYVV